MRFKKWLNKFLSAIMAKREVEVTVVGRVEDWSKDGKTIKIKMTIGERWTAEGIADYVKKQVKAIKGELKNKYGVYPSRGLQDSSGLFYDLVVNMYPGMDLTKVCFAVMVNW